MKAEADHKRVIVALDYPSAQEAMELVEKLYPSLCRLKVGKELFTAAGPTLVESVVKRGFEVFLDLKFHDIPNTVAGACRAAAQLGVWMMNVHASGGRAMLLAAREAIDSGSGHKPLLIGVTVLTSLTDDDIREIGFQGGVQANVSRLAALVNRCGLDGVVCSAQEAARLKAEHGAAFRLVTPGIRLAGDQTGDQARVVTPLDAVKMGADYLVIGRSITQSADPVATLQRINAELQQGQGSEIPV